MIIEYNEKAMQKYAELTVKVGANVQKGQKVRIWAETTQEPLALAIAEEAYKVGASLVEISWTNDKLTKLDYTYAETDMLGEVMPWEEERAKQMTVDFPVRIFIESSDPDALAGIDPDKLSEVGRRRQKVLKKYRDMIDGKHQWVIVAAASNAWAKKVFPEDAEDAALSKLWDLILSCVYFGKEEDPVTMWNYHIADLDKKAKWLNSKKFKALRYQSKNGTDFSVELIPGAKWVSAGDVNHRNGAVYVPNMPTEEIFTTPKRGKCEGKLVSTKSLSWAGQLIDNFTVEYKDGRVVKCTAQKGEDMLKQMFAMDDGASMLGEVALVPKESPVNACGVLFNNTLFDENACCHIAAGMGFNFVIDGFIDMSPEELLEKGVNDSIIHTDFMIGSDDLNITGMTENGEFIPIFENGSWSDIIKGETK